jgi:hypothetical protein
LVIEAQGVFHELGNDMLCIACVKFMFQSHHPISQIRHSLGFNAGDPALIPDHAM